MSDAPDTPDATTHDPVVIACVRLAARSKSAPEIVAELQETGVERDDLERVAHAAVVAMQVVATDSDSVNMSDPDNLVNCLVARYVDEDVALSIARCFPVVLKEELEASRDNIPRPATPRRSGCASITGVFVLAISLLALLLAA